MYKKITLFISEMSSCMSMLVGLCLIMTFVSCEKQQTPIVSQPILVNVTLEDADKIVIDEDSVIWLETKDESLLYDITNLCPMNDGSFVIQSRGSIFKLFDKKGKFRRTMATKGQGPGEFNWVGNVWSEDTIFYIYDGMLNELFSYGLNSGYIGYDTIVTPQEEIKGWCPRVEPEEVHYRPDGKGVYYMNRYLGNKPYRQRFAYSKDIHSMPDTIPGRVRVDGQTFWNNMSLVGNGERALYWEALRDTLFIVTPDTVAPHYILDYVEHALPQEVTAINNPAYRYMAVKDEVEKYVLFNRYFQAYDGWIYYVTSLEKHGYIVGINEGTDTAKVWEFVTPEGRKLLPQLFFKINGDKCMLSVIDEEKPESNPGLFVFPMSKLK